MRQLVQVSGGIDSAAALVIVHDEHPADIVQGVFYDWGQAYAHQEHLAATWLCKKLGVPLDEYQIPLRTGRLEPNEYVPYRNLVLIAHSLNLASALEMDTVVVGCKSTQVRPGDPYSFADSTLFPFIEGLNNLVYRISEPKQCRPTIKMPLAGWSKARVLQRLQKAFIAPEGLWTCYHAGPEPCGTCYHCLEFVKAKHVLESGDTL